MNRWITNALGLSGMGALCLLGWAFYQVGATVHENRADLRVAAAGARQALDPKGPDLPTIFNEARDITIRLLQPCKPGKPETCGLIPAAQQVAQNTGQATLAVKAELDQSQPVILQAAAAVQSLAEHLNKTADAATAATLQAQTDLTTLNGSIAATKPLLEAATRTNVDFNALLEGPALKAVLTNTASMTDSGAGIMADGRKVTDKATADYLSPHPWYTKVGRYAGDAFDYGALFARHTP